MTTGCSRQWSVSPGSVSRAELILWGSIGARVRWRGLVTFPVTDPSQKARHTVPAPTLEQRGGPCSPALVLVDQWGAQLTPPCLQGLLLQHRVSRDFHLLLSRVVASRGRLKRRRSHSVMLGVSRMQQKPLILSRSRAAVTCTREDSHQTPTPQ